MRILDDLRSVCALLSAVLEVLPLTMQTPLIPEMLGWCVGLRVPTKLHQEQDSSQNRSCENSSLEYNPLVGVILPSSIVVASILGPPMSAIAERVNPELLVFLGMIFSPVVTVPMAYGYGYIWLFISRSLAGVYAMLTEVAYLSLISVVFMDDNPLRMTFLGLFTFVYDLDIFGPVYAGIIYSYTNQATPFLTLGSLSLILAFVYTTLVLHCNLSYRREALIVSTSKTSNSLYFTFLKDGYMMMVAFTVILGGMPKSMLAPVISTWIMDEFPASEWHVGILFIPGLAGMILCTALANLIVSKWASYRWVFAVLCLLVDGISLIAFAFSTNLIMVSVILTLQISSSVSLRFLTFPFLTLIAELRYDISSSSSLTGFSYIIGLSSYILGPLVSSFLYPVIGMHTLTAIGLIHLLAVPFLICLRSIH